MVLGPKDQHIPIFDNYLSFLWIRSRNKSPSPGFEKDGEGRLEPKDIERFNFIIYGIIVGISLLFQSPSFTLGVTIGGAVMILNFHLTRKIFEGVFLAKKLKNIVQYSVKFLSVIAVVVFILVFLRKWVNPLGLGIGMLSTPLTIGLYGFKNLKSFKREV